MTDTHTKTGRNDPCPCGSGKKYKHCCLKIAEVIPPGDYLWHRMRRSLENLGPELLRFSAGRYGQDGLQEAWEEFTARDEAPFDPETPHMQIFMPWFFFNWLPNPEDSVVPKSAQDGLTLGEAYLERKAKQLDPLLASYIEQCCTSPFSFYDIVAVHPGAGLQVRDIFTDEAIDVTERAGSQHARVGDILFMKIVRFDQLAMAEACSAIAFPPIEKSPIVELRKTMRGRRRSLTRNDLHVWAAALTELYFDIAERLLNPPLPSLQNTDGDPMLFHRLVFDIDSPRAAFDALKHLCITDTEDELLATAEHDKNGELWRIEFSWQKAGNAKHASWSNTILGTVTIEGKRLNIEVNSAKRAVAARVLVERHLPQARIQPTVIESPQATLARSTERDTRPSQESEDFNALPEVQAQLAQMLRQHYRNWLHEKIPALDNKTPLQAVKTKDGREMVEALLLQIERNGQHASPALDPGIIAELRAALGLP